jgi:RNA polymerase sigma-70 factor (ECF subfamily)
MVRAVRLRALIKSRIPVALSTVIAEDDVFQDVCALAFKQSKTFKLEDLDSFDAWLHMLVNHCLADTIKGQRRLKRGGMVGHVRGDLDESSCLNLFARLADSSPTPSSEIAIREAVDCVRTAIAGLPDDQRCALELHHFKGRSCRDISLTMQRSVPAVEGLLKRAVRRLRTDLGRPSRYFSDVSGSEDGDHPTGP